jgi:hypothetical protein
MKSTFTKILRNFALASAVLMSVPAMNAAEPEWQEMFNGKDLTGWEGNPKLWRVENGVLIGETDDAERKAPHNTFLIWQGGKKTDFELEFQARVTTPTNNSGVQYRSRKLEGEGWRVAGYQFDLHPRQQYLGMLYEEGKGGRGIACERGQHVKFGTTKEVVGKFDVAEVDLKEWQTFRIVVKGNRFEHYVNGVLQAVIEDEDAAKRADAGIIALQLHQGPAMRAEFKGLKIRETK